LDRFGFPKVKISAFSTLRQKFTVLLSLQLQSHIHTHRFVSRDKLFPKCRKLQETQT